MLRISFYFIYLNLGFTNYLAFNYRLKLLLLLNIQTQLEGLQLKTKINAIIYNFQTSYSALCKCLENKN